MGWNILGVAPIWHFWHFQPFLPYRGPKLEKLITLKFVLLPWLDFFASCFPEFVNSNFLISTWLTLLRGGTGSTVLHPHILVSFIVYKETKPVEISCAERKLHQPQRWTVRFWPERFFRLCCRFYFSITIKLAKNEISSRDARIIGINIPRLISFVSKIRKIPKLEKNNQIKLSAIEFYTKCRIARFRPLNHEFYTKCRIARLSLNKWRFYTKCAFIQNWA